MEEIFSLNNWQALAFGFQKINIHEKGLEFPPKAHLPTPGSADLSFITTTPLPAIIHFLEEQGVGIEEGPVKRTGACSQILSIYFRDPDLNHTKLAHKP